MQEVDLSLARFASDADEEHMKACGPSLEFVGARFRGPNLDGGVLNGRHPWQS